MRQTGMTTRIVDEAIQALFTYGTVKVVDHQWPGKSEMVNSDKHAFKRVCNRLAAEHSHIDFKFDKIKNTITIEK